MNPEVKRKWVEALRSGEFPQGTEYLRRLTGYEASNTDQVTGYCCLGVLCELYRRETGDGQWHGNGFWTNPDAVLDNDYEENSATHLPAPVCAWAGLNTSIGELPTSVSYRKGERAGDLTTLNDAGVSFAETADVIEQQL